MILIYLQVITIWFEAGSGYAFLNRLAEDKKLQTKSLRRLEEILRKRNLNLKKLRDILVGQMISTLPSLM